MMYHLKFSLTGGGSRPVGGAAPAVAPSGFCSSGFCSSAAMVVPFSRVICFSLLLYWKLLNLLVFSEAMQQGLNSAANDVIHQPEVCSEDKDRHKNDDRGGLNLGPCRPNHLAHLTAHVLQEAADAFRLRLELLHSRSLLIRDCYCLGHSAASNLRIAE